MTDPDAFTAVLHQLATLTEKLSALDHREAGHAIDVRDRITALTELANAIKNTQADQAEILQSLTGLQGAVAGLADRLDDPAPVGGEQRCYSPAPSPRFWKLDGAERDEAIAKLRAWVQQVYRPGLGWLSGSLGDCWEHHPLCLYALDWLSELWSVLYLQDSRTAGTLAGQAEWQTRLLPAVAEQMARETSRCEHAGSRNGHQVGTRR
jgi:hypothetical protein